MRTAIIVLILGLTASSVMSACAGKNSVTTGLGIADTDMKASGAEETLAADLTVCGIASGKKVCIDKATISDKLQTAITTLKTDLQTLAGTRDKYIIAQRGEVVKVLDSLKKINEFSTKTDSISGTYAALAKAFVGYATTIASNFSSIVANFDTYQTSRQTCMNALIKTQGALLCQATRDNAEFDAGIAVNTAVVTATLDDKLLAKLSTACYPYIENSVKQSAIISTAVFSAGFAKLASGIEKALNNDASGAATDITAAFAEMNKASYSSTEGQQAVQFPTGTNACDTTAKTCNVWIDKVLHATTGLLDKNVANRGGEVVAKPTFVSSRVLMSEGNDRRLAGTGLDPNLDNIKFTVDFAKNPGNVDNTQNAKSALRNGIVACAVAALALVF